MSTPCRFDPPNVMGGVSGSVAIVNFPAWRIAAGTRAASSGTSTTVGAEPFGGAAGIGVFRTPRHTTTVELYQAITATQVEPDRCRTAEQQQQDGEACRDSQRRYANCGSCDSVGVDRSRGSPAS